MLNAGKNQIPRIFGLEGLKTLKALILNDNEIVHMRNLGSVKELNTLVLSHNKIEEIKNIKHLKQLKKLSVSHNRIRNIPEDLAKHHELTEVRLNNNKISRLPDSLQYNPKVKVQSPLAAPQFKPVLMVSCTLNVTLVGVSS